MFSPISSSGTAWIAPPVSRAAVTAKSPSAGLPIASERAIESGRTGVTARLLANAVATGEQPSAWPPTRRGDGPSTRPSVAEARRSPGGPCGRARPTRSARRRRPAAPAELLGDLERERLRSLGVVRAQADVDEAPVELERELDREPRAVVVGPVDRVDRRAVDRGCDELLRLEVGRARRPRPRGPPRRRGRRRRPRGCRSRSTRASSKPSSCAFAAATATTRSLKECVGFAVSSFSQSSPRPSSSARRGARTSGVKPGASRGSAGAATGSRSA